MIEDAALVSAIARKRETFSPERAVLVGISGIDASGKGFVSARLARQLEERGWNVAVIGADGWLNLPHARFNSRDTAAHFYENAMRFDEMFERVVSPLRDTRGVDVEVDFAEETAATFRKHRYNFSNIDIVLLEGIFLLKQVYRHHYDLTVWIECSFETALRRAIVRGQEGLPPAETARAFETIYFPAQRLHFAEDKPSESAELVVANDRWPEGTQA